MWCFCNVFNLVCHPNTSQIYANLPTHLTFLPLKTKPKISSPFCAPQTWVWDVSLRVIDLPRITSLKKTDLLSLITCQIRVSPQLGCSPSHYFLHAEIFAVLIFLGCDNWWDLKCASVLLWLVNSFLIFIITLALTIFLHTFLSGFWASW